MVFMKASAVWPLSCDRQSCLVAVHLAVMTVAAGAVIMALVSLLPDLIAGTAHRQALALHIESLRMQIAAVESGVSCSLPGVRLPLGEQTAWVSERAEDGMPSLCTACVCRLDTSASDSAEPACTIHDCPVYGCGGDNRSPGADPDHPCCPVCAAGPGDVTSGTAARSKPSTSPTMDPRVPVTGTVYPGTFVHLPEGICRPAPPLALLAVTSEPAAAERRALFRRLYATDAADVGLKMVFVLGVDEPVTHVLNDFYGEYDDDGEANEDGEEANAKGEGTKKEKDGARERRRRREVQAAVDAEAARHGDIIQSSVHEHYNHLALKTVSLLDAFTRICAGARFLIKTDDDVLLNVRLLAEEVARLPGEGRVVYGRPAASLQPDRPGGVWRGYGSSVREWPGERYPPLVLGNGYLVSAPAVKPLLREALAARYHHLEDVLVTGVAAQAAGVERLPWHGHCLHPPGPPPEVCVVARCAVTHRVMYEQHADRIQALLYAAGRADLRAQCDRNDTRTDGGAAI